MKSRYLQALTILLSALVSVCSAANLPPVVVDFGWLRVTQEERGWRVLEVYDPSTFADRILLGDVIVEVDAQSVRNCNAITAASVLGHLTIGAATATVIRNGTSRLLHFIPSQEPLLEMALPTISYPTSPEYTALEPAPTLELLDVTGKTYSLRYGPNWTLIHIWSTHCPTCWRDISALNEMLNPSSEKLAVVVTAIDDTAETIAGFSHLNPIEFNNLLGGNWNDGQVAKTFAPMEVPMDLIVDPAGHVTFAGTGAGSLQSALAYWKALDLR